MCFLKSDDGCFGERSEVAGDDAFRVERGIFCKEGLEILDFVSARTEMEVLREGVVMCDGDLEIGDGRSRGGTS